MGEALFRPTGEEEKKKAPSHADVVYRVSFLRTRPGTPATSLLGEA